MASTSRPGAISATPSRSGADEDGNTYVTDTQPTLQKIGPRGERLGRCRPFLNGAHGIYGMPGGDILLAESNPSRLTRLRLLD